MNVISRKAIDAAKRRHANTTSWLNRWWVVAKHEQGRSLDEVRRVYPSTDQVGRCLVFNIRGNRYRLIVAVRYATSERGGTLFVKHFLTHAEYGQDHWKKDCSCQ